ncbi:hypothetical protein ACTFIR_000465 [Dictyostelium discoideum]
MEFFSNLYGKYLSKQTNVNSHNSNNSSISSNIDFESVNLGLINRIIGFEFDENFFKRVDSNGDTALTFFISEIIKFQKSQSFNTDLKLFNNSKYRYLLDIQNDFGETPLHVAVITNNKTLTEALVKANANAGIKDYRNLTPLDMAIMLEYNDIIKILETSETSKQSNVQSNIYNWGEILTSDFLLKSESKPIKILFNDELCSPISIEYGQNFSLILTDTGAVYSSGLCSYGKTGHKIKRDISIPTQIKSLENKRIKSISCGSHHSLALDDLGLVYSWGNGSNGRLGLELHILGEKKIVSTPTLISTIASNTLDPVVVQISAGFDNSFLITSNGSVYSFGSAISEKLGYDGTVLGYQALPRKIESIPPMKQVSASNLHTVLLDTCGNVYTFGSPTNGRLGRPSNGPRNDYKPTMVSFGGTVIKKIATGTNFTIVLSDSGELFGWGGNSNGQLGFEPICNVSDSFDAPTLIKCLSNLNCGKITIHDFAVGDQHVVILSDVGEVFCFGEDRKAQCGIGISYPGHNDISLTQIQSDNFKGGNIFKVYAGAKNTMVSLSPDHHIFGEELLKLLNSNLFTDIKLKVTESDQIINAHKIVLAARCKKFHSLITLQLNYPTQPQSIKYNDYDNSSSSSTTTKYITSEIIDGILYITFPISFKVLNLFLKYLYSDHVNLTQSITDELGELSHCMGVGRLSYLCNFKNNLSLQKLPKSTLLEDLKKIQNQEYIDIYSDVQFNCISNADPSENGVIKSYKLFSYLGSSYFKSMLGGSYIESEQNEIQLNQTSIHGLRSLLKYCYCEEIPEDINECIELIILSDIHSMHRAKDITSAKIRSLMDNDSICYIYHVSKLYNVKPLSIWCLAKLTLISTTQENLKKLPYFDQLPNELKIEISNFLKK